MFARDMWSIIICRVMAGLAASTWLAFSVLYNAYFKDDESVTAMTNANAFNNGGKLLAFFLGILAATRWGYKVPLLCSFLTGLVAVVAAALLKPIEIKHESFSFNHVFDVIRTPMIIVAALFAMLPQFYMQGTAFSFTSSKAKMLGSSSFVIGVISLVFTLVQVLISPYVGKKLLKRMKSSHAVCLGLILLSISCIIISFSNTPYLLILGNIIGGIGCLILNALLMSLIVRSVSEEKRSTAMGFYQAVYGIGMTLGPVVMGNLVGTKGYGFAYMTIAVLMLVFSFVAIPVVSKAEKKLS
ncbi:MAG: MFS transporter, partial [Spirochaetales bacterium]|nr:MFS transporter [Spirochaetales bacterium]